MLIIGIDPSFSSTGFCVYDPEQQQAYLAQISKPREGNHVGNRCRSIANEVGEQIVRSGLVDACDTIHVFIENPAGALRGWAQDLPVLYWAIIMGLEAEKFLYTNIYPVASATLKKFLTGRGNCRPEDKALAVLRNYEHLIPEEMLVGPEKKGGLLAKKDAYDALGLAVLGHCFLSPVGFTKAQQESVKKVASLS